MAIFGSYNKISEAVDVDIDIDNITEFVECTNDNYFDASMNFFAESEMNYNNIMKAIAIDELYILESTGQELVYEAEQTNSFLDKFIQFFKKMWEKIAGMFKAFFDKVKEIEGVDKKFVKAFREKLSGVDVSSFKYSGFEFTYLDSKVDLDPAKIPGMKTAEEIKAAEDLKDFLAISEEDCKKKIDEFRGKLLGKENGTVTQKDFSKEVFKHFRNNSAEKKEITVSDINAVLDTIDNAKNMRAVAKKAMKDIKGPMDKIIRDLQKAKVGAMVTKGGADKSKAYSKSVKMYKDGMNAAQVYTGAKLKAIRDENRQAKAICLKLMSKKAPKEDKKEEEVNTEGFIHREGGSFLDKVVIL